MFSYLIFEEQFIILNYFKITYPLILFEYYIDPLKLLLWITGF